MKLHLGKARHALIALAVAALTLSGFTQAASAQDSLATPPDVAPAPSSDEFFRDYSDRVGGLAPGDIYRTRTISTIAFPGSTVHQYIFRSTDSQAEPVAATTSLVIPPNAKPNAPVVNYAQFINTGGTNCSTGFGLANTLQSPVTGEFTAFMNAALLKGWIVQLTDGQGPRSSFGAAQLAGHIMLDAIRAARKQTDFDLSQSKFGTLGFSGGGYMSGFAAALQDSYAPELSSVIAGHVAGMPPVDFNDLAEKYGYFSAIPNPYFGLTVSISVGLEREYPDRFQISKHVSEAGALTINATKNACLPFGVAFGTLTNGAIFLKPGTTRENLSSELQVLRENSLVYIPERPVAPTFLLAGDLDEVLLQTDRTALVAKQWCDAGVPLQFDRNPIGTHALGTVVKLPAIIEFFDNRFADKPFTRVC